MFLENLDTSDPVGRSISFTCPDLNDKRRPQILRSPSIPQKNLRVGIWYANKRRSRNPLPRNTISPLHRCLTSLKVHPESRNQWTRRRHPDPQHYTCRVHLKLFVEFTILDNSTCLDDSLTCVFLHTPYVNTINIHNVGIKELISVTQTCD